jgi:hypothetical protein
VLHRPSAFGGLPHRRELEPLFRSPANLLDITAVEPRDRSGEPGTEAAASLPEAGS